MAAVPEGAGWMEQGRGGLPVPTDGRRTDGGRTGVAKTDVAKTDVAKTDGGVPDPVAVAVRALQGLGLDEGAASGWVGLLCAQVSADGTEAVGVPVPSTDREVLAGMGSMARSAAALDASLLVSVQELVLRSGSRLLSERGVVDPEALSRTAQQTWRVTVKSAVAGELQVLLGVSPWEARQLVSVAAYPGLIRSPILAALRRGEVNRRLVTAFHVETRRLDVDQAGRVSVALFGTDAAMAAVERLDADGHLRLDRPWHHQEFYAALKREVTKVRAVDEGASDEDRKIAFEGRSVRMDVEGDGTAGLTCTMSTATGVALYARVEGMARRARAGGDRRTLTQLRADIVAILLLYGTVTLPGDREGDKGGCLPAAADAESPFDEVISPADAEALRAIITATPAGHVDLIIPWDALVGAVCPRCRGSVAIPEVTERPRERVADSPHSRCLGTARCHGVLSESATEERQPVTGAGGLPAMAPVSASTTLPVAGPQDPGQVRAGELIGWESAFITPRQARAIVLTPGSVLGRLLTNPDDGRCIERSISRYTPDAQMRRQVRAADVYGRGPGSRRPALQCELDHEKEWLTHGWTAEVNLNAKDRLDHARKTKRLWRSVMNRRRDVTWTTLLGQVARTRGHDYRQYVERATSLAPYESEQRHDGNLRAEPGRLEIDRADLAARRDLVNQVVYSAIVHRRPGERAEADDDVLGSEDWLSIGDWGHLQHLDANGQRRPGPPPSHPTPEQILRLAESGPLPRRGVGRNASDPQDSGSRGSGRHGTGRRSSDTQDVPGIPRTDSIGRGPALEPPPF